MDETLQAKVDEFVKAADEKIAAHWRASNYTIPKPTHAAEVISDKWVKVVTVEAGHRGRSVYAFIAVADFANKTLGQVRRGGIHKPASWKAPAKHERGNLFADDWRNCLTPYGIVYLRG